MSAKKSAEGLIGGRVYTLSGYEEEEYLQKVATYINNKLSEFNEMEGAMHLSADMRSTLIELNIADDYFKEFAKTEAMKDEMAAKEKELYDLKHDLVNAQMKLENMDKSAKILRDELNEKDKKILRLETELKGLKKS